MIRKAYRDLISNRRRRKRHGKGNGQRTLRFEQLEDRRMLALTFDMTFLPDTIGPGSVSMLQYTISNDAGSPVTDIAFSNTLPAAVTIAADPGISIANLGGDFMFSAPAGGGTISLTDGSLAAFATATLLVNVTSSTVGTHMNTTSTLTSSTETTGAASDDLTVATNRPGFTMSFAPGSVQLGQRTTLTYTIDNSANGSSVDNLDFTHNLPTGLVIADPANVVLSNVGTATIPATVT